jgi:hypothetical protein
MVGMTTPEDFVFTVWYEVGAGNRRDVYVGDGVCCRKILADLLDSDVDSPVAVAVAISLDGVGDGLGWTTSDVVLVIISPVDSTSVVAVVASVDVGDGAIVLGSNVDVRF